MEAEKKNQKINVMKNWFFVKVNKNDKPLVKSRKRKRKKDTS